MSKAGRELVPEVECNVVVVFIEHASGADGGRQPGQGLNAVGRVGAYWGMRHVVGGWGTNGAPQRWDGCGWASCGGPWWDEGPTSGLGAGEG